MLCCSGEPTIRTNEYLLDMEMILFVFVIFLIEKCEIMDESENQLNLW